MQLHSMPTVSIGCLALALAACGEPGYEQGSWRAMGTQAEAAVHTRTRPDAATAVEEIRRRIAEAERDLDPRAVDGELGRINREAIEGFVDIGRPDLYRCLTLALDYARESRGAYDPTLGAALRLHEARVEQARSITPRELDLALSWVGWEKVTLAPEAMAVHFRAPGLQLDLGTVGQGCALDWAARTFARPGSLGGLLRIGGVWRAWGVPPDGGAWRLELADPRDPQRALLRLEVNNRAAAVAGHREDAAAAGPLYLDRATGLPAATDLLAAVAVADSAADAAALAHALFVSGSLGGSDFLGRTRRAEAILVVREEAGTAHVLASASLEGRIELAPQLEAETAGDVRFLLPPRTL